MGRTRHGFRKLYAIPLAACVAACLATAPAHAAPTTDLGQAVADMGGSEIQIRAADAIYVTCIGLALNGNNNTPEQAQLGGRCADMTQTGFALDPTFNPDTIPPAADVLGLGTSGIPEYFGLVQQLSGEEVSTQGRYATEGSTSQFKTLAARLSAIRRGAPRSGITFNLQGVEVFSIADAGDPAHAAFPTGGGASSDDRPEGDLGLAWFTNVEYGYGDRDRTENEDGYEADSYGGLIGLDYAFNESWTAGVALYFGESDVSFDEESSGSLAAVSGGGLDSEWQTLSVFVDFSSDAMYASGIVSVGQSEFDMSRPVVIPLTSGGGVSGGLAPLFDKATADTDSDSVSAEGQLGFMFGDGATRWDLYGGLNVSRIEIDSFTESGSVLGLSYDDQDVDSFQGFIGAALMHSIATGAGVVVPYASAEYRYEFENEGRTLDARYALTPGVNTGFFTQGETDNFQILTDDADESFFDITVGVSAQLPNAFLAFVQFSALVGLEDTKANLLTLGIRRKF
jgi:uncharacterized protein with beta-barrel porin domain